MDYLRIRNWEKYQHYSHRRPPWIKVYWALLTEPNFTLMADASKLHTIAIMLLASQHDNKVPFNKTWITRAIQANTRINWDEILSSGFIECYQDASNVLASRQQGASPRARSRETDDSETDDSETETDAKAENSKPQIAMTIPLAGGKEYALTEEMILEFTPLYPGISIRDECLKAKAWLIANPARGKTKSGIMRFLNSWFGRAQNNGGIRSSSTSNSGQTDTSWILNTETIHGKRRE